MSEANEIALAKLDKLISDLQWQIFNAGGSEAASTSMLVKRLTEAQNRSATVHREEQREKEKKDQTEQQEQSVAIAKAERELALTQSEQREYASFLECDYFTKSMFGELDRFYTRTWDRLTEEGKTEMSQRVWEGVRRGEYEFLELPDSVKEKEAKRINAVLTKAGSRDALDAHVNAEDRLDFLAAYQSGLRDTAYAVLNRRSFAEAMRGELGSEIVAVDATKDQEALKARIKTAMETPRDEVAPVSENSPNLLADLDLDADVLNKLKASQDAAPAVPTELVAPPSVRRR